MDLIIVIVSSILIFIGLVGCIIPVIPGPPISFLGLLLLKLTDLVEVQRTDRFDDILWATGIAALAVTIIDFLVPVWGTKKFGGSGAGTAGAAIGLIVGLFFGPPGIIAGPFLGAVAGEMITGKDQRSSLRSGIGSLIGLLTGVILKLIVSGVISWYFVKELIVS